MEEVRDLNEIVTLGTTGATGDNINTKKDDIDIIIDEQDPLTKSEYFEFKGITVKVGDKQILKGISGRLEKGRLVGIMGGSGAGKTTLLNTLSGRLLTKGNQKVGGEIGYKGEKFEIGKSNVIKHISAYVMQHDILCPTQTVREAIQFSACLRLSSDMTMEQKEKRVDDIISSLKLDKCKNTQIGNEIVRGVSGGEKKRTSVAVELVTDPQLLFLDEPTSGLDAFTALKTLEILKSLTLQGKQIIATIHQPSTDIFYLLDYVMLMADGYCVYYGPKENVLNYFQSVGYQIPQYNNPADFVVNCIQQHSSHFIDSWKKYNEQLTVMSNFDNYSKFVPRPVVRSNLLTQINFIMKREIYSFIRDPRCFAVRFIQTCVFAGCAAILFWKLPHNQSGLSNRFGVIFFCITNSSMSGIGSTILVFPEQRILLEKERDSNMYLTTTCLIAKSLIKLIEQCIFSILYTIIVYWAVGLDSTLSEVLLTVFLAMIASGSVGIVLGCFGKDVNEAMQFMPVALLPMILFTNYLVTISQIPIWIRWLQWIDIFKYAIEAMCITEFRNIPYSGSPYKNGNEYLESLNINKNDLVFDWWMAVVLYFGFQIICWIILVRRSGM